MEKGAHYFLDGQKQRVAIARALYFGAEILLFDEATSALDNETEKQLTDAMANLPKDLTLIIVAHRYSSLRNCDTIYEINDGEIVEEMSFDDLEKRS